MAAIGFLNNVFDNTSNELVRVSNTVKHIKDYKIKNLFKVPIKIIAWSPYAGIALEKLHISGHFFKDLKNNAIVTNVSKNLKIVLRSFLPVELLGSICELFNASVSYIKKEKKLDAHGRPTEELKTPLSELGFKFLSSINYTCDNLINLPYLVTSLNLEAALPVVTTFTRLNLIGLIGGFSLMTNFIRNSRNSYRALNTLRARLLNVENPIEQHTLNAKKWEKIWKTAGNVSLAALGLILMIGNLIGIGSTLSFSILVTTTIPLFTTFAAQYALESKPPQPIQV